MPAVAVADRVAALRSRNPSKGRAVAVLRFRGWKAERAGVRDWADYPGGWWRPEHRQGSRFSPPLAIGLGLRLGAVERIHLPQPCVHDPVVYCVEYAPEARRHSHHAASGTKPPRNAANAASACDRASPNSLVRSAANW